MELFGLSLGDRATLFVGDERNTLSGKLTDVNKRAGVKGEAVLPPHPNPLPRIGVFQSIRVRRGGEGEAVPVDDVSDTHSRPEGEQAEARVRDVQP